MSKRFQEKQSFNGGIAVPLYDIPADAGAGKGIFEDEEQDLEGIIETLRENSQNYYGAVGQRWIQWIAENADEIPALYKKFKDENEFLLKPTLSEHKTFVNGFVPEVALAFKNFEATAFAGWLAIEKEFLSLTQTELLEAVRSCFMAWYESRGEKEVVKKTS